MRRLRKSDFEGKTIVNAYVDADNVLSLDFSDGTEISVWAKPSFDPGHETLAQLITTDARRKHAKK